MIKNNIPCIIATLTALMTLPVISSKPSQDFIKIFDGKTLDGWEAMPANTSPAWTVENGMIVGNGAKARSYIVYQNKEVADLELKFAYRFPGKGNSGVSIRAIVDPTGKRGFQSYHADIGHLGIGPQVLGAWDFHTPGRREHRCFRGERLVIDENDKPTLTKIKGAVTKDDINKNDWNKVHVVVRGQLLQVLHQRQARLRVHRELAAKETSQAGNDPVSIARPRHVRPLQGYVLEGLEIGRNSGLFYREETIDCLLLYPFGWPGPGPACRSR